MRNKGKLFSFLAVIPLIIHVIQIYARYFGEYGLSFSDVFHGWQLVWQVALVLLIISLLMNSRKLAVLPCVVLFTYDFRFMIDGLLACLAYAFADIALAVILLASIGALGEELKKSIRHLWFIPGALYLCGGLADFFYTWRVLWWVFLLLMGYWATSVLPTESADDTMTSVSAPKDYRYCDILVHILLTLFTFGIWQFIWIYRTTEFLNTPPSMSGETFYEVRRNPTKKLLLCMFVPFYYIYWTYKSAQRIDRLAASRGVQSDITSLCLILTFILGVLPPMIIMQDKINKIVKAKPIVNTSATAKQTAATSTNWNSTVQNTNPTPAASAGATIIGTADEIKKYKELLDVGAITQEEFDAKKKQLLGM